MKRIAPLFCSLLGSIVTLSAAEPSTGAAEKRPANAAAAAPGTPAAPAKKPDYVNQLAAPLEPTRLVTYREIGGRELKLHIFQPKGWKATDRRACYLTVHGGGWVNGEPRRMYPFASHYADLGMVGISIEYRLRKPGSGVTPFDCASDGRAAIRYVKSHAAELGIDPDKIVASGGSAGGHIAAGMALFDGIDTPEEKSAVSARPAALILYYPVIDTSPAGFGNKACGERWREISPLHQVRAGAPPAILFHGTADKTTPYAGAKAFQEAMAAVGSRCELVTEAGAGHTYLMAEKALFEQTLKQSDAFLASLKLLNP